VYSRVYVSGGDHMDDYLRFFVGDALVDVVLVFGCVVFMVLV